MVCSIYGDVVENEVVFGVDDASCIDDIVIDANLKPAKCIDEVNEILKAYSIEVTDEWLNCICDFLLIEGTEVDFTE